MAFGLVVPVSLLFRASTVARLADWLESARGLGAPEFTPVAHGPRPPRLPLALAQERLWFLSQMEGVSEAYHICTGAHLHGALYHTALVRALVRIVARHDALRTTFV